MAQVLLAIRVPEGWVEKIDAYQERMQNDNPAFSVSRADALRYMIQKEIQEKPPSEETE